MNKCFVIMPITTPDEFVATYGNNLDHFQRVYECLFKPAIEKAGFEAVPPDAEGAEIIHARIINLLETADLVLCDMLINNENVFLELGIRIPLNKPVCLVKDDITTRIPFDTSIINHHEYSSDLRPWKMEEEIEELAKHISRSYENSNGSNTLWKYFGLSNIAEQHKDADDDNKFDFIIRQLEALREMIRSDQQSEINISGSLAQIRQQTILRVVAECDGDQTKAAKRLGIARGTLNRLLQDYRKSSGNNEPLKAIIQHSLNNSNGNKEEAANTLGLSLEDFHKLIKTYSIIVND